MSPWRPRQIETYLKSPHSHTHVPHTNKWQAPMEQHRYSHTHKVFLVGAFLWGSCCFLTNNFISPNSWPTLTNYIFLWYITPLTHWFWTLSSIKSWLGAPHHYLLDSVHPMTTTISGNDLPLDRPLLSLVGARHAILECLNTNRAFHILRDILWIFLFLLSIWTLLTILWTVSFRCIKYSF